MKTHFFTVNNLVSINFVLTIFMHIGTWIQIVNKSFLIHQNVYVPTGNENVSMV